MYSAERQFVTTAHSQLRLLERGSMDTHLLAEAAIGKIKKASDPVKARAVYRAALLCEDVLKRCASTTDMKFLTALSRLSSLVGLYASGLFEIDPDFKSTLNGNVPIPSKVTAKAPIAATTPEQLEAANENAAKLLQPLLRLVKDDAQAEALSFLAKHGQPAQNGKLSQRKSIHFDTLMRQITNHTLGEARAKAKNVSISYAADFETIDTSIATDIQFLLQTACIEIVRNGLVVNGDLASSLNHNWQLSITGKTIGQKLALTLGWHGQALSGFQNNGKAAQALKNIGGHMVNKARQNPDKTRQNPGRHNTGPHNTAISDVQILEFICPLRKTSEPDLAQNEMLHKQANKG